jgi:hypothetical protein
MIERKVDPINVQWYNNSGTDSQKCQHQVTQEVTWFDDVTTDAVHNTNFVKEIRYPGMIKASDGDTVLDENHVNPINLCWQQEQLLGKHSESTNCTSESSNSGTIVMATNGSSNGTRKIPATIFYGKIKC